MKYRVAVLGAGKIAASHLKAIQSVGRLEAVAIADVIEERVSRTSESLNIRPYLDYREMIETEKPDIAIVALPPYLHKEASVFCAWKGCHLLLEKPMAMNVDECEDIIRAAALHNVRLMVGHTVHYMAANRLVKRLIDEGTFGDLIMVNDTRRVHYYTDRLDWFFQKGKAGGGILMNLGSHSIDKIQWLTGGKVTTVRSSLSFKGPGDIEGAGVVFLETDRGVPATIVQSGYTGAPRNETEFVFTQGMIKLTWEVWTSKGGPYEKVPVEDGENPFRLQLLDLLEAIEGSKPLECSGEYAKSIISVVQGIYRSHAERKETRVTV